jgi:uncharacterized membrane protein YedE/YeeE
MSNTLLAVPLFPVEKYILWLVFMCIAVFLVACITICAVDPIVRLWREYRGKK